MTPLKVIVWSWLRDPVRGSAILAARFEAARKTS